MLSPGAFKSLQVFHYDYAYLDSGAPASPNYVTWVFVHGMGFNGAVLEKLLPLAHVHNLRIVSIYRRGYAPSSGFKEEELTGIGFGKKIEEAEPFCRAQGVEIATFLVNVATGQDIPLADPDSHTGGIVLIGWSLGCIHVTAVLAYLDEAPEDIRSMLQKYLHTVLFHEPTSIGFGISPSEKQNLNLWSQTNARERFDAFFDWVSGHYIHESVTSNNIDDLEFNSPSDVSSSLQALSYAQRANYTDLGAFDSTGCDGKLPFCDAIVFRIIVKRALFDRARAETLPHLRVRFMSGGTSPGIFVWTLDA